MGAVFQISCSSVTDTLCSTMMIKVVLVVAILLIGAEAATYSGCGWGDEHLCSNDLFCSYGCSEGKCWSQCVGACPGEGPNGDQCSMCKEWCWLKGVWHDYESCSVDSDCFYASGNKCNGACSIF